MTDLVITATSVAPNGNTRTETGTWGATITAGLVVMKGTDGKYVTADADNTAADEVYAISLGGGSSGQPGVVALPGSEVNLGATLTPGTPYFLSDNAGGICPFADLETGDRVIFLGIAKSASIFIFRPLDSGVILAGG